MKRLSEYIKEAEDWVEALISNPPFPTVRVVLISDEDGNVTGYSNDPFVKVVAFDQSLENEDTKETLQKELAPCPYPIDVTVLPDIP